MYYPGSLEWYFLMLKVEKQLRLIWLLTKISFICCILFKNIILGLVLILELILYHFSKARIMRYWHNKMINNAVGDKFISYSDMIINHSSHDNATMFIVNELKGLPIYILQEFCKYGGKIEIVDDCNIKPKRCKKAAGYFSYRKDYRPFIQIEFGNFYALGHEFGHFIDALMNYKSYTIKFMIVFWIERVKYFYKLFNYDYNLFNTNYYQTNEEWFAESFSFLCYNGKRESIKEIPLTRKSILEAVYYIRDKYEINKIN